MPGIIVSRPIFNTLFKLAHEEGLSINAFLTRLLEKAGPDALTQAVTGSSQASVATFSAVDSPEGVGGGVQIAGTERIAGDLGHAQTGSISAEQAALADQRSMMPTSAGAIASDAYSTGGTGRRDSELNGQDRGRRIGNSIWDKVVSMEGHRFATSRGKRFSYKVTGEYIVVRDSSARIPRSQFDKAQKMWPVSGPSRLVGVYAPSVVWAVMKEASEPEMALA